MSGSVALVVGTVLAVGALAFVLYPLFFSVGARSLPAREDASPADDSAILALREIEFDRATGKLSDSDYAELKSSYSTQALREMRAATPTAAAEVTRPPATAPPLDDIEARVRQVREAHRECPTCGVRPEPDAIYCSTCGGYLDRACPTCKADVAEPGAAFCSRCGAALAPPAPALR